MSNSQPQPLKYSEPIAKYVRQSVKDGVQIKDIMATINKRYQNAPRNLATFYKYYGGDVSEARAEISSRVGNVVVEQALNGHFPSQELFLRSKAGGSPKETVQAEEMSVDPDQDASAIDTLMTLLGKNPDDSKDNSTDT